MRHLFPNSKNKFFWMLYTVIYIIHGYYIIFNNWKLQNYGLRELEDFGRILFVLILNAFESALFAVILWWIIKKIFTKQND